MQNKPVISVIIPVYNVEKYLRRCLDSVLNQTFSDWEAICVNDGSPDGCAAILSEYASRDARFKIVNKENGGQSDARNVGMAAARGDYILYLDSDDFIHPQTMEITHYLAELHDADMVSFRYDVAFFKRLRRMMGRGIDVSNVPHENVRMYDAAHVKKRITNDVYKYTTERNHVGFNFRRPWLIKHCQVWKNLYRRSLIADIPFINGILLEDFPWWVAVLMRHPRTVITKLPLYFYMPNAASSLNSIKALRLIKSACRGLIATQDLCAGVGASEQRYISREFMWPFIIIAMRSCRGLTDANDIATARHELQRVASTGAFDNPPNHRAAKYQKRIYAFIQHGK